MFILEGLIIFPSSTLSPTFEKNLSQWKMTDYTGCQQKNIVHHPGHFLPYLKAQAEKKTDATLSNQLKKLFV